MNIQFSKSQKDILTQLSTNQKFSLQQLAQHCQTTISQLQQDLDFLIQHNVPILHQPSQFYQLIIPWRPLILHDCTENIVTLDIVDSTNQYLKANCFQNQTVLCCAEMQTQGKGRFGRQWESPFGLNLYFSYRSSIPQTSGLSLIIGLAMSKALEPHHVEIKWPNDLIVQHQKLGGILIEVLTITPQQSELIIGVGLNVNGLLQTGISLRQICQHVIDRSLLLDKLFRTLKQYLDVFKQHGLQAFQDEWRYKDYLYEKPVVFYKKTMQITGIAKGITENGQLILIDAHNNEHQLDSGEVSTKSLGQ